MCRVNLLQKGTHFQTMFSILFWLGENCYKVLKLGLDWRLRSEIEFRFLALIVLTLGMFEIDKIGSVVADFCTEVSYKVSVSSPSWMLAVVGAMCLPLEHFRLNSHQLLSKFSGIKTWMLTYIFFGSILYPWE